MLRHGRCAPWSAPATTNFAFRTEQAAVASLNNWASEVDTDGQGTINACNFAVAGAGGDAGAEALALGYDWFYSALSATFKTSVYSRLNDWIAFDDTAYDSNEPHSNYFEGYYATKAYAALATEGDNMNATAMWGDFLNRIHKGGPNSLGTHTGVADH